MKKNEKAEKIGKIEIDPKKTNSSAIDLRDEDINNKNASAEFNYNNMNTLG